MSEPSIRPGQSQDLSALVGLYQAVASHAGSLARRSEEIDAAYVQAFVSKASKDGVWLVAEDSEGLCADIHASRPQPRDFQHVLGELTIVVHPRAQGQGLGRRLFGAFLEHVREHESGVIRVELITRESNARARRLYESLGFQLEGRLRSRVRHLDGRLEDDLFYAWLRPRTPTERPHETPHLELGLERPAVEPPRHRLQKG
jgi:RimJ/RimL family protein N-acetyltransferase